MLADGFAIGTERTCNHHHSSLPNLILFATTVLLVLLLQLLPGPIRRKLGKFRTPTPLVLRRLIIDRTGGKVARDNLLRFHLFPLLLVLQQQQWMNAPATCGIDYKRTTLR